MNEVGYDSSVVFSSSFSVFSHYHVKSKPFFCISVMSSIIISKSNLNIGDESADKCVLVGILYFQMLPELIMY